MNLTFTFRTDARIIKTESNFYCVWHLQHITMSIPADVAFRIVSIYHCHHKTYYRINILINDKHLMIFVKIKAQSHTSGSFNPPSLRYFVSYLSTYTQHYLCRDATHGRANCITPLRFSIF